MAINLMKEGNSFILNYTLADSFCQAESRRIFAEVCGFSEENSGVS